MQRLGIWIFVLALISMACACVPHSNSDSPEVQTDRRIYSQIRRLLDQGGSRLDYVVLMEIYAAMSEADAPIADMHGLLAAMIRKRNDHPRVDQMILIFAAKAIGESQFFIPHAGELFDAMLDQPARLNEWVISFVAGGIGQYPYEIARGDQLVDRLDAELSRIRNTADPSAEMFGFHFLPPPRHALIKSYLSGISEQRQRMLERNCYYLLIRRNIAENDIATSMSYLQAREQAGAAPPCPLVMQCLLNMQSQLPLK